MTSKAIRRSNVEKLIERINELAGKEKEEGLTREEKEEQAGLRQEYLARFRQNFKAMLDNTVIVAPDGSRKRLKKDDGIKH